MTKGYLLDTNIISYWFLENRDPEHKHVRNKVAEVGRSPLMTSAVVLGELIFGYEVAPSSTRSSVGGILQLPRIQNLRVLEVTTSTAMLYGRVKSALFEKYAPKRRKHGLRPEQLVDPITSKELGVQENDLWIASQAIERNIVLVTHDKKMRRIQDATLQLRMEDWAEPPGS